MSIPPRFLDDIRSRLSLSDVIGKRMRLTRAGREHKGCCPFHKEKSPSFTVNDDKQFFHCFGCGAHGDVIGFVMRYENLSFIEVVESLAGQAGLQMPKPSQQEIQKAEKARDLHALMEAAARWMEEQLFNPANRDVLSDVEQRGISRETISSFRIGYAPGDRQALRKFLAAEKFSDAQMIEAGLIKRSDKSPDPYAFFRDRVMFPVTDRRGRIVAFGGRILPDHLRPPESGDYKPAKYINSSDTPLFDKSRTLYGQSFARQAARDGAQILVTEGYMDVIACHQAGFKGAVAPMGTALTEDQIVMLWAMIVTEEKIPVLCFDGDNAGRGAAVRACERIMPHLKPYHTARFAFLPEGEDPDSLIKAGGPEAFQKILDGALSLFDFLWLTHTAGRKFETPESRAGLEQTLGNAIKTIGDREVQKYYLRDLKNRIYETFLHNASRGGGGSKNSEERGLGAGADNRGAWQGRKSGSQQKGFGRPTAIPGRGPSRPMGPAPRAPGFADIYERVMVAALLNHPHIFEEIEDTLGQMEFKNRACDRVRQAALSALSSDPALDRETLRNHLKSQGLEKETGDIIHESVYVHASFAGPSAEAGTVAKTWLDFCRDVQKSAHRQEMQNGWKQAFISSDADEEEKLKAMMSGTE